MSLTFASLFCGGGSTVTTPVVKSTVDDDTNTMSFFCRPRRPNSKYHDISQYPLLDNRSSRMGSHSKPIYDTSLLVHDVVQENQPEMSEGEKPVSKRINHTPNCPDESSQSLYSASKDVALIWMEMGNCTSRDDPQPPQCEQSATTNVRRNRNTTSTSYWKAVAQQPRFSNGNRTLLDSTRHNRVHDTQGAGTGTGSPKRCSGPANVGSVQNVPSTRLTPGHKRPSRHAFAGSWKGMTVMTGMTGSGSPRPTVRSRSTRSTTGSIPPAPPQYSHKRRFRVCFGVMSDWDSAVDPQSGRTYYYNAVTRETQWRKPMELASDDERILMEEKERKQREFFLAMEANIIKSIAVGSIMSPAPITRKESVKPVRTKIIRTISSMDAGMLKDMIKRTPSMRNMARPSSGDGMRISTLEKIVEAEMEQSSLDFGNSSMSMFDESSANLGVSFSEIKALKELAKISMEMESISDQDEELDYSMSDGLDMSLQDFTVSLSDGLDFSIRDLDTKLASAPKKTGNSSFMDSLVFSPEMIDKKSVSTNLEAGDIVFTPDVMYEPEPKKPPAVEKLEEPILRSGLKAKPPIVRRNTCGTLYVGSTMSAPDKDATIKVSRSVPDSNLPRRNHMLTRLRLYQCICGVFRAHILGAEQEDTEEGIVYDSTKDKYRLFNDRESERRTFVAVEEEELSLDDLCLAVTEPEIPTLETITTFYRNVFTRSQMEPDCIIMSLIYVERLVKVTDGLLRPRRSNWRSLLFSCMILSSKVWDDMSMWNSDFSQSCPPGVHFPVKRINELELAILKALAYKVKVPASEYAKYYFLLRSMLIKSGLGGDDLQTMNPLDVEGAKKLEQVSTNFQNLAVSKRRAMQQDKLRSKSMGDADRQKLRGNKGGARLEHMVQM